jgi:hypothetical protein
MALALPGSIDEPGGCIGESTGVQTCHTPPSHAAGATAPGWFNVMRGAHRHAAIHRNCGGMSRRLSFRNWKVGTKQKGSAFAMTEEEQGHGSIGQRHLTRFCGAI